MDGWVVFQLGVDIVVFVILLLLVFRGAAQKGPDVEELRSIVNDFEKALEEGRHIVRELDSRVKPGKDTRIPPGITRENQVNGGEAKFNNAGESTGVDSRSIAERKRSVRMLYLKGFPREEISRKLAMPVSEVELIIAMLES